ncbi:MAG: TolB family protein [Acidimicrobiia bacterium]
MTGSRLSRKQFAAMGILAVITFFVAISLVGPDGDETELRTGAPASPPVPSQSASTPAPAQAVALSRDGGMVVLLEVATGRHLHTLASHPPTAGDPVLQGVATAPSAGRAYYALAGGCGEGTIARVRLDGRGEPVTVARGISPAVSPDGRRLAYAAPGRPRSDGRPACFNAIAVKDLRTGKTRTWRYPDDGDHSGALYTESSFTKLAWSPDSRRLAFTVSYEGDSISVLDTTTHDGLAQAIEVVIPGGGGDSRHPTWHAPTGSLAVVNRAFECCYDDAYTGPPRTVLVDVENRVAEDLFPPGLTPNWLDFDVSGEHLLYVDETDLFRRSEGGEPALVAPGFTAADW